MIVGAFFGARTSHGHTQIHKTHRNPDLREATTFPIIVLYVACHGGYTQMVIFLGFTSQKSHNSQNWDSCHFGSP